MREALTPPLGHPQEQHAREGIQEEAQVRPLTPWTESYLQQYLAELSAVMCDSVDVVKKLPG